MGEGWGEGEKNAPPFGAESENQLKPKLSIFAGLVILLLVLACGSSEQEASPTTAQVADVSQFPTPTRSQAEPQPTSPPVAVQVQTTQNATDGDEAPMTEEEIQELRQRLQSGELSEEEAQQAFQRLRSQFGDVPGGPGGSQVAGSIESIEETSLTIATDLASVSVNVGTDTIIMITSVLEPTALTDDTQVMVVSERQEGKTLARTITIIPEGQTGFRGGGLGRLGGGQGAPGTNQAAPGRGQGGLSANQAAPGGGQGGFGGTQGAPFGRGGLFGTVTGVSDTGFTLETQQGPLPITIDDDSVILETQEGAFTDLEIGMQVRVAGPAAENGTIEARSVIVTPDGLEDTRRTDTGL